ncbi:MAG: late competence protein [Bacteroidetes bacterium]|nr:late competence protein [Bacteroidota bacterium]
MSIKKSTFIFILTAILCLPSLRIQAQQSSLTIHQLGLADGDAGLYVIMDTTVAAGFAPSHRDTTVILIDAQRDYCSVPLFKYVDSILRWLHRPILDYVVLSHVHIDHYGSMVALMDSLRIHRDSVTKVFDRFGLIGARYPYVYTAKLSKSAVAYKNYMQQKSVAGRFAWGSIQPDSNLLVDKHLTNFSITCLSANGRCMNNTGHDSIFIPKNATGKYEIKASKNENDLSYSFLLTFGAFNYYTGGDLGGGGGGYANGETPIVQYLHGAKPAGFHVCAFKVDHHGSEYSTNDSLVALMNPTLAIVPAALRSFNGTTLPTNTAISKLRTANDSIRYTFIPSNPGVNVNNWKLAYLQDVVLSITGVPANGANVTMNVSRRRRSKNSRRLDGTVVNEVITCTKTHN